MNDYVIELCVVYIGVKFLKTQSDKAVVCYSVSLSTDQVTTKDGTLAGSFFITCLVQYVTCPGSYVVTTVTFLAVAYFNYQAFPTVSTSD